MHIIELTEKMNLFVTSKGWYKYNSKKPQTPKNLAISLVLEANEILEYFQWSDSCTDMSALAGELADVTLYLFQLASVTHIDLEKAVLDTLSVNQARSWDVTT